MQDTRAAFQKIASELPHAVRDSARSLPPTHLRHGNHHGVFHYNNTTITLQKRYNNTAITPPTHLRHEDHHGVFHEMTYAMRYATRSTR
jgi:hypothetical protein